MPGSGSLPQSCALRCRRRCLLAFDLCLTPTLRCFLFRVKPVVLKEFHFPLPSRSRGITVGSRILQLRFKRLRFPFMTYKKRKKKKKRKERKEKKPNPQPEKAFIQDLLKSQRFLHPSCCSPGCSALWGCSQWAESATGPPESCSAGQGCRNPGVWEAALAAPFPGPAGTQGNGVGCKTCR